jgi:hypothetical protein
MPDFQTLMCMRSWWPRMGTRGWRGLHSKPPSLHVLLACWCQAPCALGIHCRAAYLLSGLMWRKPWRDPDAQRVISIMAPSLQPPYSFLNKRGSGTHLTMAFLMFQQTRSSCFPTDKEHIKTFYVSRFQVAKYQSLYAPVVQELSKLFVLNNVIDHI